MKLGVIVLIFIPAGIFSVLENWNYGTSLYYVIVTLSTIGFGDYVAGKQVTANIFELLSLILFLYLHLSVFMDPIIGYGNL